MIFYTLLRTWIIFKNFIYEPDLLEHAETETVKIGSKKRPMK